MIRSLTLKAIRDFFDERGLIEINTPKIVSAATEGGTALFPISYFERVYEIAPIFRAEEHVTTKHLNEATLVDVKLAFVSDNI